MQVFNQLFETKYIFMEGCTAIRHAPNSLSPLTPLVRSHRRIRPRSAAQCTLRRAAPRRAAPRRAAHCPAQRKAAPARSEFVFRLRSETWLPKLANEALCPPPKPLEDPPPYYDKPTDEVARLALAHPIPSHPDTRGAQQPCARAARR